MSYTVTPWSRANSEREVGLVRIVDGQAVGLDVLDHVGPAEVAGRADIDADVHDLPGRHLLAGVRAEDLLDHRLAHDRPPLLMLTGSACLR
jgi:hypothetical protein